MRPELVGQSNAVQLREHPSLTTGLLSNMRPELVGRLNVVPITGLRFRFRLFHPLCCSEDVLLAKGSFKGKNGGESSNDGANSKFKTEGANSGSKMEGANSGSKTEGANSKSKMEGVNSGSKTED
uniref:Predicted protein n=1 Tax=Physcomitrium patens TaxID=3218 RepID=A9U3M0_PHYPA